MPSYFIRQNGRMVQGPFDEARIRGWIAQGRVRPEMEFSADGQLWIPGSEHRLFAEGGGGVAPVGGPPAAVGSSAKPLVVPWPPSPLPGGTQITYTGDRSTGFGMWGLMLHEDPLELVAQDEAGVSINLVLRHVRSQWTDFFDVFALCVVGRVGVLGGGELSLGFRIGDAETWEPTNGPCTDFEEFENGVLSATRVVAAIPDRVLAMSVPDQQVWMRLEINGQLFERKLRLGRLRSSLRTFVEYFRIEELRALWVRGETEDSSDDEFNAAKQALYAHTLG